MAAGTYDFLLEQGATFDPLITWRDAAGALVNVTGYTARMMVRPSLASATVSLDMTTANGMIVLGGAAGTIQLLVSATATAGLGVGGYVYDLELVSGVGVVRRLLKGAITVDGEVTR